MPDLHLFDAFQNLYAMTYKGPQKVSSKLVLTADHDDDIFNWFHPITSTPLKTNWLQPAFNFKINSIIFPNKEEGLEFFTHFSYLNLKKMEDVAKVLVYLGQDGKALLSYAHLDWHFTFRFQLNQ